jgi:hypothetical protein
MGLLKYRNKSISMVLVDFLSKYDHFYSLQHTFKSFMDNVFKLYCMLQSIMMDHEPNFTRFFLQDFFFLLQGTQLNRSIAYHPQTNGQNEVVHKCME